MNFRVGAMLFGAVLMALEPGFAREGPAWPGGGTPEKPVGLVHIGLADEKGPKERAFRFPGDRERIRTQATNAALDMVRRYFLYAARGKG